MQQRHPVSWFQHATKAVAGRYVAVTQMQLMILLHSQPHILCGTPTWLARNGWRGASWCPWSSNFVKEMEMGRLRYCYLLLSVSLPARAVCVMQAKLQSCLQTNKLVVRTCTAITVPAAFTVRSMRMYRTQLGRRSTPPAQSGPPMPVNPHDPHSHDPLISQSNPHQQPSHTFGCSHLGLLPVLLVLRRCAGSR